MPLKQHRDHVQVAQAAGVEIRAARPGDLEDLCAVMACPGVVHGTMQLPWTPDQLRERWFDPASVNATNRFLVATTVHNGTPIGNISLMVRTTVRQRHIADLGMGVHDDFQGRGVGTALMAAALHYADQWLNLRRVELTVFADNAAGLALYEKFGFEREGVIPEYAFRDGEYVDAVMMGREHPALRQLRG